MRLPVILPKPDYRDPAEVAERRERQAMLEAAKLTCAGCVLNRLDGDAYHCSLAISGFPLLGKDKCQWWGPKNERRRNR